jgi:hypothetical protein
MAAQESGDGVRTLPLSSRFSPFGISTKRKAFA